MYKNYKSWRDTFLVNNEVKSEIRIFFLLFQKKIPHSYSESFIHLKHQLLYCIQRRSVFATRTFVLSRTQLVLF